MRLAAAQDRLREPPASCAVPESQSSSARSGRPPGQAFGHQYRPCYNMVTHANKLHKLSSTAFSCCLEQSLLRTQWQHSITTVLHFYTNRFDTGFVDYYWLVRRREPPPRMWRSL